MPNILDRRDVALDAAAEPVEGLSRRTRGGRSVKALEV